MQNNLPDKQPLSALLSEYSPRPGKRFYQKALEIGPKFRPAYVGMIRMAVATSSVAVTNTGAKALGRM